MIKPSIYEEQNVLHLAFKKHVQLQHFVMFKRTLPSIFRRLRPDFTLLTDLSGVEEIDFACCTSIADLMECIVEAGVGEVLRVVPDPRKDIGLNILAFFHYPKSIHVRVYEELSEAMKALSIEYGFALDDSISTEPIQIY